MFKESNIRSIAKMLSWRGSGTIATMVLVYILTGEVRVAAIVGGFEIFVKMVLYYLHERLWDKINIGRRTAKPFVIWFTGLPCSGKSTLADETFEYLVKKGIKAERLDGDTVRSIFPATGFSKEERNSHIKRIGFLASMLEKNGVFVVASFVSPYEESRKFIKGLCGKFIEVYVSTPVEECEKRDVKGMYKKAREGEIKNFTGVSDPYEVPTDADIVIETTRTDPETSFTEIKKYIAPHIK